MTVCVQQLRRALVVMERVTNDPLKHPNTIRKGEKMSYASKSSVPVDRSQGEIRKILSKYGASGFAYGEQGDFSVVMFEMQKRRIKFVLPMPQRTSERATGASIKTYEQLCRTRWRCLVLAIKAKLECVESGITTLDQEFMAHIVLPNGQTVGALMLPQIDSAYKSNKMPPLLGYSP